MFTCPRCGSHEYKSVTLGDGSIERECKGKIVEGVSIPISKNVIGHGRVATFRPATDAPLALHQHARACTFIWKVEDDAKYGVES